MLNGPPRGACDPDALAAVQDRDWVLVLGMHRSGTSSVTGMLAEMGLQEPHLDDLLVGHPGNPNHHESRSLSSFDEDLLSALGGSWSAPPDAPEGWELTAAGREWSAAAAGTALAAYPQHRPAVVKDPRMCLLMPFWSGVLGRPRGVLLMWRDPLSVARSVAHVSGWPLVHGLALWEAYNRRLLSSLAGQNVYVLGYNDLVTDPRAFASDAAAWLDAVGVQETSRALKLPQADLRHFVETAGSAADGLLPAHQELVATLGGLRGHHPEFSTPPRPAPTPWTEGLLSLRREFEEAHHRVRSRVQVEFELGRLGMAYTALASAVNGAGLVTGLPKVD